MRARELGNPTAPEVMREAAQVFNIESVARGWYNFRSGFRYLFIGMIVGFLLLMLALPPLNGVVTGHGFSIGPGGRYLIILPFFLFIFVMVGYFLSGELLGPIRLILDDEGVHFQFTSGSERVYRWNDHRFKIELHDMRTRPDLIRKIQPPFVCSAWGTIDLISPLTPEAHDALLAMARVHGMTLLGSRDGDHRTFTTDWYPGEIHRILYSSGN
jgi:hypothetical protein